jgi:methyl-accepting chemotaxis protein
VAKKIWIGFSVLLVFMLIIGITGSISRSNLNKEYTFLLDDRVGKVNMADELINAQKDSFVAINGYVLFKTSDYVAARDAALEQSQVLIAKLDGVFIERENKAIMEEIKEISALYNEKVEAISYNMLRSTDDQVRVLAREAATYNNMLTVKAEELKALQQKEMQKAKNDLNTRNKFSTLMTTLLILAGVVISIVVASLISRSIARPVATMTAAIERIAAGDLKAGPVNIKNHDEIGTMASAFNKMTADLTGMIERIRFTSQQLASQAEQLSASSEESLTSSEMVASAAETNMRGSEQQTDLVNESVDSMDHLRQGVHQIASSNEEMLSSTKSVVIHVTDGSNIVSEVAGQMNNIHLTINNSAMIIRQMAEQSLEIQKVTSLITAIAEQTNLLALNAAIEAARAGDHGKGFAVVAEEVRKLAEQSKNSATEIETMMNTIQAETAKAVQSIEDGSRSVAAGLTSTESSMHVFKEIEQAVNEVNLKVGTVSVAIEQIKAMTNTVSEGSLEIKKLAEAAAATAQETSAATEEQLAVNEEISSSSQELALVADSLQKEINRFQI